MYVNVGFFYVFLFDSDVVLLVNILVLVICNMNNMIIMLVYFLVEFSQSEELCL